MPAEVIINLNKNSKKIYLNEFIEKNSHILKNKFLENVQNIGKKKIFKKNLRDFFEFKKSINLWDLSHFNEKNIFKEDYINKCLQYLAILKIIQDNKVKEIFLNNVDIEILKALKKYKRNINFILLIKKEKSYRENFKNFVLGNWATSLLFFLKNNMSIYRKHYKKDLNNKNLIVSYFCHYEKDFDKKSFFVSDHWRGLEKEIKKNFFYLNFFIASKKYKTYGILKKNINNKIKNLKQKNFLDNYFGSIDIIKIILYTLAYAYKFHFLYFILKKKMILRLHY